MNIWKTTKEHSEKALQNWNTCMEGLRKWEGEGGNSFKFSEKIPNLSQNINTTILDLDSKLQSTLGLIIDLCQTNDVTLIPRDLHPVNWSSFD